MKIFDSPPDPSKTGRKEHVEGDFYYLSKSARPRAAELREMLEAWFSHYPEEHQAELKARIIKSGADFADSYFELLVHEILRALGANISVHPDVPGARHRPDFKVELATGFSFYLEATVCRSESQEERKRANEIAHLYQYLDERFESDYGWSIGVLQSSKKNPRVKSLLGAIKNHEKTLVRDELIAAEGRGFDLTWQDADWVIQLSPIPLKPTITRRSHRPLQGFLGPCEWVTTREDIRASIVAKIAHHARIDLPYLIAVSAYSWTTNETQFLDAAYGTRSVAIDTEGYAHQARDLDGIWPYRARNAHLLGILGGMHLSTPWGIKEASLTLFSNPYNPKPNTGDFDALTRYVSVNSRDLQRLDGQNPYDLLKLNFQSGTEIEDE